MQVNFLVAGTQKGGTSAIDQYLRQHPELSMARRKEVHFFDREWHFTSSEVDYSIYHSYFDTDKSGCLYGEVTPIYMYWYRAPERVWNYNREMKWILILRNPIERAYSHWNMEHDRGREAVSFFDAICTERNRCRKALPYQDRRYSYVDRGFYVEQIRRIWHYFPMEQTLIFKSEELRHNLSTILNKISDFLEIEPFPSNNPQVVHAREYLTQLSQNERDFLRHIYEFEVKQLERMLGWDCSNWLET